MIDYTKPHIYRRQIIETGKYYIGKTKHQNIPQNINLKWVRENKILGIKDFYSSDDIFEENNLYIHGDTLKNTIEFIREEFESIYKDILMRDDSINNETIQNDLE